MYTTASTMTVNSDAWLPYFKVRQLNAWRSVRRGAACGVCSGGCCILLSSPTCRFYRAQCEKQAEHGKQHKISHVLRFDDALGKIFMVLGECELGQNLAEIRPRKIRRMADEPEKEKTSPGNSTGDNLILGPGGAQKAKGKECGAEEERTEIAGQNWSRVKMGIQPCQERIEEA